MAYDFDQLFSETPKDPAVQPVAKQGYDFDALFAEPKQETAQASMYEASFGNPDQEAQRRQVARDLETYLGDTTPPAILDLQDAQRRVRVAEMDHATRDRPKTSAWLSNVDNARIAGDDAKTLANIERILDDFQYGKIGPQTGPEATFRSVVSGLVGSFGQGARAAREGVRLQAADLLGFDTVGQDAMQRYRHIEGERRATTPEIDDPTAKAVYGGLDSTVRMVPGLIASVASKSTVPMLASMGLQTESEAYAKYRERGGTGAEAITGAVGEGAVEVLTELLPAGNLLKSLTGAGWKTFAKSQIQEQIGEQLATGLQDAIDTAIANPNKTWAEYWNERPAAAYQTFIATLTQGVVMAGGKAALSPSATPEQAGADQLQELFTLASQSLTKGRDAQTFGEFFQSVAGDTSVFIEPQALREALAQAGVESSVLPSFIAQEAEAENVGAVEIPVAELVSALAGTGAETSLIPNLRIGSMDALTLTEAQENSSKAIELFQQEAEKAFTKATVDEQFTSELKTLEADYLGQLNAASPYSAQQNQSMATLTAVAYKVMAHRLGRTPLQVRDGYTDAAGVQHKGYRLNIQNGSQKNLGNATFGQDGNTNGPAGATSAVDHDKIGKYPVLSAHMDAYAENPQLLIDELVDILGEYARVAVGLRGIYKEELGKRPRNSTQSIDGERAYKLSGVSTVGVTADWDYAGSGELSEGLKSAINTLKRYQYGDTPYIAVVVGENHKSNYGGVANDIGEMIISKQRVVGYIRRAKKETVSNEQPSRQDGEILRQGPRGTFDPNDPNILHQSGFVERRAAPRLRTEDLEKPLEDMSIEELQASLIRLRQHTNTNPLTGLPSKAVWDAKQAEGKSKDFVASLDADGLKWFNDAIGHETGGNVLLNRIGAALLDAGIDAYHISGDEFYAMADSQEALDSALKVAQDELSKTVISGNGWNVTGAGFSYGIATNMEEAEYGLKQNKAQRQEQGLREERGVAPAGAVRTDGSTDGSGTAGVGGGAAGNAQGADSGVELYQKDEPRDLVVQHNLTAENLLHALKMGGIPVPSLAITKKTTPLTGFGEITLLGSKDMADPKGYAKTQVFGADIYSPRYPNVEYQFTAKQEKALETKLKEAIEATDSRPDWDELKRDGARALERSAPVMWQLLKDQGIDPAIVRKESKPLPAALQSFANDNRFAHELEADPAFIEAAWQARIDELTPAYDGDVEAAKAEVAQDRKRAEEKGVSYFVKGYARQVFQHKQNQSADGKVDAQATRYALEKQLRDLSTDAAMVKYARGLFDTIGANERIFKGYTDSGNRKYVPHTLENVVKILKQELRGGEGFNYGVGSIRAKFTPQFKSIEQIRKAKDRLLTKERFEQVKEEISNEFDVVRDQLASHHSYGKEFGFGDTVTQTMYDSATMGVPRALKENGFDEVPAVTQKEMAEFLGKLRELPTEYFEAKILRDVDLAEFSGAVVPEGVDPQVIEALESRGIKDIRYYKQGDAADRTAKIGEFDNLFFQQKAENRAAFNPNTLDLTFLANADSTSFHHELGHFFLTVYADIASQEGAPADVVADVNALLKWFDPAMTLEQWQGLSIDQQRPYHEQAAESFEQYLFSGRAPVPELQPMFKRMAKWFSEVYATLKAFVASHPGAQLNPEISAIYDRMLATDAEIATAMEQRNYQAMFKEAVEAGMTPEAFAAYQNLAPEMQAEAEEALRVRGLRDMKWMRNRRSKVLAELQAEAKEKRHEVMIDARREVMTQPIYRAWQFLTSKIAPEDRISPLPIRKSNPDVVDDSVDSLLTAIGKLGGLDKAEVLGTWGTDPADKPQSGVFGKPVWRVENGMSIDGMAEALGQYGYLNKDENGRVDLAEFELLFSESVRGNPQYSLNVDASAFAEMRPGEMIANPSALMSGKFDRQMLRELGLHSAFIEHLDNLRMVADTGLPPDLVAENFEGFSSGEDLVRQILAAPSPKYEIENVTDRMMLERYGDLATDKAIEIAADEAIHNDIRTRMVATELNALDASLGSVPVLMKAAKEYARQVVASKSLKTLKPWYFSAEESRNGKKAMEALRKGDREGAAKFKRAELFNHLAAKEAHAGLRELEKAVARLKKIAAYSDKDASAKARDMEMVNALRAVLSEFGIGSKGEKAAAYLKVVERMAPENAAILKQLIDDTTANAKDYSELSLNEMRELRDQVDGVWEQAKAARNITINGQRMLLTEAQEQVAAKLLESPITSPSGQHQAITADEESKISFSRLLAKVKRVENWVGWKDGQDRFGPLRRLIWMPINDGQNRYAASRQEAFKKVRQLLDPIMADMAVRKIDATQPGEINYTFGAGDAVGMSELLHAILHTGNDSNKQKLLLGRGWAEQNDDGTIDASRWDKTIARLQKEGVLTKAHYDFAQSMWDYMESLKPGAQIAHKAAFGRFFDEVTFNPVVTPWGTYKGGYMPATPERNADRGADLRSLQEDATTGMITTLPQPQSGFTKGRVEGYNTRLELNLRALTRHVDSVLLFTHMSGPVRDVQRILKGKDVLAAMDATDKSALHHVLLPWLLHASTQTVSYSSGSGFENLRVFKTLRSRTGMTFMMANIMNSMQQVTGFAGAALKANKGHLLHAAVQNVTRPRELAEHVASLSPYMNGRLNDELGAIADQMDAILIAPSKLESAQKWASRHAYFMQMTIDSAMSPMIWLAKYNEVKESGTASNDIELEALERKAIELADNVVRTTQGSQRPIDIAAFEAGSPFYRMFTQFAGWASTMANTMAEEVIIAKGLPSKSAMAKRVAVVALLGYVTVGLTSALIATAFRGGPDDGDDDGDIDLADWLLAVLFDGLIKYPIGMIPVGGAVIQSLIGQLTDQRYDDKISGAPAISALESLGGVVKHGATLVHNAFSDDDKEFKAGQAIRDVGTLIGIGLGLPVAPLTKAAAYGVDVGMGKVQPTGPIDAIRGTITGKASPQSKQ